MTVATMTLRAARQRNVVLAVVGASMLVSLLLLSQTHSRLRRAEDDVEKCQQKHDSVAAQLTVLYEHKARLEKTLQAEIERKKSVDDELKTMQSALSKERAVQAEKVAKLQRQNDELKTNRNEEYIKLKNTYESLRNDKEKLYSENEELNLQIQKLKDNNHKLEEEVHKMQQSEPIDMNEVERLRERVRQCDADQASRQQQQTGQGAVAPGHDHAGDERTGAGNEVSRTFDAAATGQFSGPVIAGSDTNAGAAKSNDSLAQAGAPDEMTPDMAVLPVPQGKNLGVSSSAKPLPVAGEAVDVADAPAGAEAAGGDENKGILNVPLDSMQQADAAGERKSLLGHQFGANVDRNEVAVFRQNGNAKAVEKEDRDYPDNLKDDDAGPDDGEEGGGGNDNKKNPQAPQPGDENDAVAGNVALEDLNNHNAAGGAAVGSNLKLNPDFEDPNINVNVEPPRGVKVLPK
ncbi:uncharacterized protein LOC111265542 isoform X2 [Varroa jacobsoni]|uniref:Golgi integral membrane protein 4 n=1 Tax=Varroa destructor TaxID=109461 RepID=A0A7M7KF79_VARDE|nr:uncharacterized protein LOC111252375 isoform X2 [Varroa destructor]XP_022698081.1 uncharacterized protein LOC111265542 isoform X2 [Varroa jacobsoni]